MHHTLLAPTMLLLVACSTDTSTSTSTSTSTTNTEAAPTLPPAQTGVPPVSGLHLQTLVATSGAGVEALLDGDPSTGWRPDGDARDEGVLLRFEEPTRVLQANLQLCRDSAAATFQTFVDGSENTLTRINPGGPVLLPWRGGAEAPTLKSLFVRALNTDGDLCIAEIALVLPPERNTEVKPPRAVRATVEASSVLEPADAYHPGYLFDGRTDFGWVEGTEGLGVGESLTLAFDSPVTFEALDLWNGYQRSDDHFAKNARLASLKISADGGEPVALSVADTMGSQTLTLPAPMTGSQVVLEIAQATAGSKYQDLVLSELRLRDGDGPIAPTTPDLEQRRAALLQQVASTDLANIVDRSWTNVCDGNVRLKLRSNHSFVVYIDVEDGPDDTHHEVFDGAWVVRSQEMGVASIQLFGRRHRTETSWVPYGDSQVTSTVRIAGGKSKAWLHGPGNQQRTAKLLDDPAFRNEHAYCEDRGTAWMDAHGHDLLVIEGSSLAGVFEHL